MRTHVVKSTVRFDKQCRALGLPLPVAEYRFHPVRQWRFDWAFVHEQLAVEIDGGVFLPAGGRHNRGPGFRKDTEKYAEALMLGWRVLRVLPEHITTGQALTWIQHIVNGPPTRSTPTLF